LVTVYGTSAAILLNDDNIINVAIAADLIKV
jgi:hypothetical protein